MSQFNPWSKDYMKNLTLKDGDNFNRSFNYSSKTQSGAMVSDASALTQSAVYACVRVLSETVASLPLRVYEVDGETRKGVDHPLNRLLGVTPNGEQTAFELREFQMTCLGLRGNAYAQKLYSNRGVIGEINPLNSAYMNVDRDSAGRLVFDYQETNNNKVYSVDEIWRIAALGSNGVTGLSPIQQARESIGTAMAVEGHGASVFKNGVNPSIVLSSDGVLSDVAFDRLREQLETNSAGFGNAGKPFLAEGGMKPYTVSMTNQDAQFIESRKFQAEDIARWYRVPPHMIGLLDRATFSNIEQQSIDFVVNTIRPWLVRIEATMMRDLLSPQEQGRYFLSHTVEGLLRGDTKTRYEAYGSGIDKGWLTRNEARLLENRQPIYGLDEPVLPVNVQTVSEREQNLQNSLAEVLGDQESNALRQERNKGGDDFGDRMVSFYSKFKDRLVNYGASTEDATKYVLTRAEQVESGQFDKIERSAQLKIAEIL